MPKIRGHPPLPEKTPGFAWRVSLSIIVFFGWFIFLILWLMFYAGRFNIYQNIAVVLVSILVAMAILAASWASWGIRYGFRHRDERWEHDRRYRQYDRRTKR